MNPRLRALVRPLLVLVTFTVLPQIQLRPLWSSAFIVLLIGYRAWLEISQRPMPPRWVLWLGQVTVAVAIWSHFHTFFGDEAAGTLLTLLIGLKIYELREKRDFFITCILCFLVLMGYLLADQGLLMTGFLIVNVVLVVTVMHALEAEQWTWTWTSWKPFLRPGLSLTLKALPLLVLTFLLFPRFSTGFGAGSKSVGRMGVSETLQPGSVSRLIASDEVVFRATFLSGDVPPLSTMYWRGAVFDEVDGMNWTRDRDLERPPSQVSAPNRGDVEVYLEPNSDRFLFALDNAGWLGFPSDVQNRRVRLRDGNVFELVEPLPARDRYVFELRENVEDSPPTSRQTFVNEEPSAEMRTFLKSFAGKSPSNSVRDLLLRFHDSGYVYSLQPPPASSLDQFFFNTKEGYCEHYSGTMATILRRLKIPARVVVGYQGGSATFLGDYITVRGHDAHSWVEYYDQEIKRWRRVDPTSQVAPARLTLGSENYLQAEDSLKSYSWLARVSSRTKLRARAFFDQVDATWTGFLLGFDLAWQREWLGKMGMDGVLFRALPVFLILSLALILALLYFFESQRREKVPEDEQLYRGLQKQLRRHGIERAPNEGPLTLLKKTESVSQELVVAVESILTPLIRARFGRDPLTSTAVQNIKLKIKSLKKIKVRVPTSQPRQSF